MNISTLKQYCLIEIARAESIINTAYDNGKKPHEPTICNFRGQLATAQKILALLDNREFVGYTRVELLEWYVKARSDGWECQSVEAEGDKWDYAALIKDGMVAEIHISGGILVIWDKNKQIIEKPIPYENTYSR